MNGIKLMDKWRHRKSRRFTVILEGKDGCIHPVRFTLVEPGRYELENLEDRRVWRFVHRWN